GWEETARTLAVGKFDSVLSSTGKSAADFKPGKFFKDDGRKLARYLACAMKYGGTAEDVEPAWFDFLSRRSPATTPRIEAGDLHWKDLLAVQVAITYQIGKQPRGGAGLALRRAIAAAR